MRFTLLAVFCAAAMVVPPYAVRATAQISGAMEIVIVIDGREAMGFVPRPEPYTDGGPAVASEVTEPNARTSKGLPIKRLRFIGWREGDGVRVFAFAAVPIASAPESAPMEDGDARRVDFGSLFIRPGEEKPFPGMKESGMTPWIVRARLRR